MDKLPVQSSLAPGSSEGRSRQSLTYPHFLVPRRRVGGGGGGRRRLKVVRGSRVGMTISQRVLQIRAVLSLPCSSLHRLMAVIIMGIGAWDPFHPSSLSLHEYVLPKSFPAEQYTRNPWNT